ncbi:MAG TPA: ankyrin repeat domain-containing protein, partial [Hyphomicrobiales bacterium]|nr:ankyrin repeat domain-containing protein [Hyphomicrobiales bacterium]
MKLKKLVIAAGLCSALGALQPALAASELVTAIAANDADLVRTLVRQSNDVNAPETDGTMPLQWAIYYENPRAVKTLLDADADVEAANREGVTPLALAAQTGNAEIVELLLDAGANVNNTMANGETPLMMAARTGDLETIQLILDRGADIDAAENLRGTTALMWAAANRNAPAIKLLIENGASTGVNSAATNEGRTNPYLAPTARNRIREFYDDVGISRAVDKPEELRGDASAEVTREELLKRLPPVLVEDFMRDERERANRQAVDAQQQKMKRGGLTALHFAVREGDLESVKVLVEAG